jgi:hypothetical protein
MEITRRLDYGAEMTLAEMQTIGSLFAKSGYFEDAKGEAQAIVKVMIGRELGVPPFAAMSGIHIIKGKPGIGAGLLASLVRQSGRYDYRVVELTEQRCEILFTRRAGDRWEDAGRSEFTRADAEKAQSGVGGMLGKYPRNMLFARALSNGVRWYCPDVTSGPVYTPEELGAVVDEQDRVIDATAVEVPAPVEPTPVAVPVDAKAERNAAWEALVTSDGWTVSNGDLAAARDMASSLLGRDVVKLKDLTADDFRAARGELLARNAARRRYYAIAGAVTDEASDRARIYGYLGISPVGIRRALTAEQWATAADAADLEKRGPQEPLTTDLDAEDTADDSDPFETAAA